ncbi:hypothetical protein PLICRDRAFT_94907 [Plicaturopsis crispa FD-325 SS-3]|uniref:Uncharacterized protein n=1 Tax=Plicaturopsis crispa FD-325 SS-3 TaxID=944288 RepID=A0A0C9SRK8_PLICR|nr:hypothetical protein PLICRDRAFT_94907 [Plicaturopsis crispa FD-325 SS-3]
MASATDYRPARNGTSSRFRESVHLIPTPGVERKRPKRYEPLILNVWIVAAIALLMIGLAVALEVALNISYKNNGFAVPERNVFSFVSTQFLTSFFPTLLVAPLALLWGVTDWMIRWYQPYVNLSRNSAPAEESLLLDYIALNKLYTVWVSAKHGHWLLHVSTITALATYILQPLAGSIFQIRQLPFTQDTNVTSISSIGLAPNIAALNAFSAAAGFAEAAVINGLQDPPFIIGGWATAEFAFPENPVLNGSMTANTTAVQTNVNCANPTSQKLDTPGTGNYTITSTSTAGCTVTAQFDPSSSEQQYGVSAVPNCGSTSTNATLQPVMFWYFHMRVDNGKPETRTVFCTPTIRIFDVMANATRPDIPNANLNNGSLINVTSIDEYPKANNVTGSPLSGQAFNGVVFDPSPNSFVAARALTANSGVPGAIFRFASQLPNGPQTTFDDTNGFLDITKHVYTQHLALVAKSIYFVPGNQTIPAKMTSLMPRLWIEPLSGHALAVVLFLIGIVGIVVHFIHSRARRNLYLTSPPGSIAAIVSLTSRSGFGDLLLPYDDEETLRRKLSGLRFRLDRRTGAIVADEHGPADKTDRASTAPLGLPDLPYEPLKTPYDP